MVQYKSVIFFPTFSQFPLSVKYLFLLKVLLSASIHSYRAHDEKLFIVEQLDVLL